MIARCAPPNTLTEPTPADAGELVGELVVEDVEQVAQRPARIGDGQAHDRDRVGVGFLDDRLAEVRVVGELRGGARDLLLDVGRGDVDVGAELERGADGRLAGDGVRLEVVDAGDAADRVLERPGDRGLHGLRGDVAVVHRDRDDGRLEARQQGDRQPRDGEETEHDDGGGHHRDGDAAGYGKIGDRHVVLRRAGLRNSLADLAGMALGGRTRPVRTPWSCP